MTYEDFLQKVKDLYAKEEKRFAEDGEDEAAQEIVNDNLPVYNNELVEIFASNSDLWGEVPSCDGIDIITSIRDAVREFAGEDLEEHIREDREQKERHKALNKRRA